MHTLLEFLTNVEQEAENIHLETLHQVHRQLDVSRVDAKALSVVALLLLLGAFLAATLLALGRVVATVTVG